MDIVALLEEEWQKLSAYTKKGVSITTTAKLADQFKVLPRRYANDVAIAGFLINDETILKETVQFFDGKIDCFYADVEAKQAINLYRITKETAEDSAVSAMKSNDITLEAGDLLLRDFFKDDLEGKNILVIGTGNLASKIALRTSERRANVVIDGRSTHKLNQLVTTLNQITPRFSPELSTLEAFKSTGQSLDAVVSFLSGTYWCDETLKSLIHHQTFVIDGGINNFSKNMTQYLISQQVQLTRLDVRLGLLYQFLMEMGDTRRFLSEIYGKSVINGFSIVSGGFMGKEGDVIVDQIHQPSQIIGIADGMGGLKESTQFTSREQEALKTINNSMPFDVEQPAELDG